MNSSPASVPLQPNIASATEVSSYQLLEQFNDVVCVLDEAEAIVFVNSAASHFWGYLPQELKGKPASSFIYTEDLAATRAALEQCRQEQVPAEFENRTLRKDGRLIDACWSVRWHAAEKVFYCVVRNGAGHAQLLQQSEKRFRSLVAGGHDLVGIVSQEGIYTYVGENIQEVLGFTPQQVEGRSFTEFIHPDDLPSLLEQFGTVVARGKTIIPHFRFRNKAGQWRWMDTRVTNLLHDPHIQGLVINSRDITEEKASHDKLRELSIIAQESLQAIVIANTSQEITWVNKAFCTTSGYDATAVTGKKLLEIFPLVLEEPAGQQPASQTSQYGLCLQQEVLCHAKGGKPYWMHLHIQPVYNEYKVLMQYLVIGKDITERKEAELELARSEQRFKALVQEGSDVIVIVDREGLFTYSSDSIFKVLGYGPSEILHKNIFSFIHPEDISETLAGIERVKNNVTIGGVRHRFRHKDGSYRWLESKGTNHFDSPLVQGMIVNARDITEKVLLQQKLDSELKNKQKEITSAVIKAQESERSKLGLELHDNVNQVLTTVKLYNEMYLSGYMEDRSLLERSARYLQDCINEIRSISKRLSAPTLGKITLQDSIHDLVDSINLTNKLQINLHTEGVEHLHIPEDLHLGIYRIIQESLNNIIKYAQATKAEVRIEYNGELLNLLVRDNGKGFDGTKKGGGIGITNMKTRAENLNGIFELHTAAGEGCTIAVSFLI